MNWPTAAQYVARHSRHKIIILTDAVPQRMPEVVLITSTLSETRHDVDGQRQRRRTERRQTANSSSAQTTAATR